MSRNYQPNMIRRPRQGAVKQVETISKMKTVLAINRLKDSNLSTIFFIQFLSSFKKTETHINPCHCCLVKVMKYKIFHKRAPTRKILDNGADFGHFCWFYLIYGSENQKRIELSTPHFDFLGVCVGLVVGLGELVGEWLVHIDEWYKLLIWSRNIWRGLVKKKRNMLCLRFTRNIRNSIKYKKLRTKLSYK